MTDEPTRQLKYPWIGTMKPGDEHFIEDGTFRCREFKAAQAYAWRRGWKLSAHWTKTGLQVTRKA